MERDHFEDEHEAYRESFRSFLSRVVTDRYPEWQEAGTMPREVFAIAGEHGFAAMQVPPEFGGAGIDDFRFSQVLAEETMAAGVAALGLMLVVHNDVCVPALIQARRSCLDGLAAGDLVAAWVAPGQVRCESGRLHGTARGTVNGGIADLLVVSVDDDLLIIDADAVQRRPSAPLVGMRACDRSDLVFDGVEAGHLVARRPVDEHLALAALAMGGATAALSWTLDYVHERRAFGIPIARFQNTRQALGGIAAELAVTQAYVNRCALERNAGRLEPWRAAAAKLQATELHARAVDWGVQLHGGYGYMLEYPIAHAFADARFLRLYGGGSEQLKDGIADAIGV